jgi:hypothetical protein
MHLPSYRRCARLAIATLRSSQGGAKINNNWNSPQLAEKSNNKKGDRRKGVGRTFFSKAREPVGASAALCAALDMPAATHEARYTAKALAIVGSLNGGCGCGSGHSRQRIIDVEFFEILNLPRLIGGEASFT